MLEDYLKSSATRNRLRNGLAAPYLDDFADWLHGRGYKSLSITRMLRSLAGWADWMRLAEFGAKDLLAGLKACKEELNRDGRVSYSRGANRASVSAASVFVEFLQEAGVIPAPAAPFSPLLRWTILGDFR